MAYVVESPYTGQVLQRAAEKVKPYISRWELMPDEEEQREQPAAEEEDQELPPRIRRPPRRLIEEGY